MNDKDTVLNRRFRLSAGFNYMSGFQLRNTDMKNSIDPWMVVVVTCLSFHVSDEHWDI